MRIGVNLFAGLANSIWTGLIGLAVVPIYLKYLGVEAYGLIGFYATTQTVFTLLDMGMTPTINREVAKYSAMGRLTEVGNLLHTLAVFYWSIAVLIALTVLLSSNWIALQWLRTAQLDPQTVTQAVVLMGLVIACRWPVGLYQGVLIGAQRITVSSSINIIMISLSSFGAIAVLAFVSPTIKAFFIWQASIGIIHALTMRWAAWKTIGKSSSVVFDLKILQSIWRFSASMGIVTLSGVLFMQLDKIILSRTLILEDFGYYMLAAVMVSGMGVIITPVYNIIYPRFTALVVSNHKLDLLNLYKNGTRLFVSVIFPLGMLLVVFSEEVLFVWTRNPVLAAKAAPIVSLLAIGASLHSVMYFPYALQLAYGKTRLPLLINTLLSIFMLPLITYLAISYGAIGGAAALAILHVAYVICGTYLTHRQLLKGEGLNWLLQDVALPMGFALLAGYISYGFIKFNIHSNELKLVLGFSMAIFTFFVSTVSSEKLRLLAWSSLIKNRNVK
jgi:O-antigen/teichoic acid export membrane protein